MAKNKQESESEVDLKSCPFCGSDDLGVMSNAVECLNCSACVLNDDDDPSIKWNRRVVEGGE